MAGSSPRVYVGTFSARWPGVGSKRTQPEPGKYSSGQAWRSWEENSHVLGPAELGSRKPTATRAGMPMMRAMIAIEAANCSQ